MLRILTVALVICAAACAGAPTMPSSIAPRPMPAVVTDATYAEILRKYHTLRVGDPQRAPLRERLVQHRVGKNGDLVGAGDYPALVEHLRSITALYTPAELAEGPLPAGLEPIAHKLIELGSPRGDEARVLSGLYVLARVRADQPEHGKLYRKIKEWGFDARASLSAPLDRFEGLVETWEEHAELTPTPEILGTLARVYVDRRNAMIELFQSSEQRVPLTAAVFQGVQRTAMDVAAIYLRHGDVASALTHVQAMGPVGGMEERLIDILQLAREDGADGAGAMLDLARGYLERMRHDVAHALCVHGLRRRPQDARFSTCLGRVAATRNDFAGAMAWYSAAVLLVPEDRGLYDEILEVLNSLMEQGLFGADTAQTREIATRAGEILEERLARWPDTPPPVKPEELYLAIAMAEMNAGNAEEAEARLRESLEAEETVGALMQLGLLLERMNRGAEAAEVYRRALLLATQRAEGPPRRAEILERLGDALRMQGNGMEANRMYEQGLALWDANLARLKGRRIGLAHLRRGVLLGRLERRGDSITAFEKAMDMAPGLRETYSTILAYLVVTEPDHGFASRVFRHALNQLSLEPEWKVYFALWLRTIAARKGERTEDDVNNVLKDLAAGNAWSARLAQFASGLLTYDALLSHAGDRGERTEAHFYEGTRRLASGDREGARAMFRLVLDTHMVNFYEFSMAQELLTSSSRP